MILQSLEPPGAKNAHLLDVCRAAEVKLTLKSQTTNVYWDLDIGVVSRALLPTLPLKNRWAGIMKSGVNSVLCLT